MARVNLEEQRRRAIEEFEKFGAIKKNLHLLPEYERNINAPKLPEHDLPVTSHYRGQGYRKFCQQVSLELIDNYFSFLFYLGDGRYLYKELEKQRKMDELRRQLKGINNNPPDNDQ